MHRLRLPETGYPTGYNATPSAARNCFPTLMSCGNLRGPAKNSMFRIELYSIFRDLLPRHWRFASEVHEVESKKKNGDIRWRLYHTDSGSSGSNGHFSSSKRN
jgi:hypothetical protein